MRSCMCLAIVLLCWCGLCGADPVGEAEALILAGEHEAAVRLLTPIKEPESLRILGNCHKRMKNWSRAAACFEELLTYSAFPEKDVKTWIMDCYFADGHYSGYRLLDELIETYPDDVGEFYYVVGRRHQWMHRYPAAVEYLGKAIEALPIRHPDAQDAAQRYILCALTSGDFDKALTYLPTYTKHYPEQMPNLIAGQMYRWRSKVLDAIHIIEETLDSMPAGAYNRDAVKVGLAEFYVAIRDWGKASKLLASIPEPSGNWYAVQAKCYRGQLEFDKAML